VIGLAYRCSLVVFDEAHQAVAPTYADVTELLTRKHPDGALLGLTATPGRSWSNIDIDEELVNFFEGQKVRLEVEGYDSPVEYLIRQGYLARPRFERISSTATLSLTEKERLELAESLDVPDFVLRRLADDETRTLLILQRIERALALHQRLLVFATTVDHARLLTTVLRARGVEALCVTAETDHHERTRAVELYRSNLDKPVVLCNFGIFTAGFDAPRTSAVLIARPTWSLVLYSQMVGRATRGRRAGGNESAEVLTIVDPGLPGFGDLAEAFDNWEDVWR
jgi:superfamily II DNA or RNA helicase